jgi:exosortase/archaeosortase family protein
LATKQNKRKQEQAKLREKAHKKEVNKNLLKQFVPLLVAVLLWFVTLMVLHLPSIKNDVALFFVKLTLDTALIFGKILFIPMQSHSFPYITVDGYTMQIVMECTAYNFYIFVFYLSLLSPVNWKQRLVTLAIFIGAVFIVNNLRFITLGFIGNNMASSFNFIHDYLWNILFGFMVFLIWAWRYNSTEV